MARRPPPVYSTRSDSDKRCPRCTLAPCRCPVPRSLPPEQQEAHIRREKKGRRGGTVITISNLRLTPADLKSLAKELRQICASGGTVKGSIIEIQGDNREKIAAALGALGYKIKFTGG